MAIQKTVRRIGNSKGILLSRDMLAHLGVGETIEISMEPGRIVLTAPSSVSIKPGAKQTVQEAMEATFEQYDNTMQRLAGYQEDPSS